eukprot:gene11384-biopygen7846
MFWCCLPTLLLSSPQDPPRAGQIPRAHPEQPESGWLCPRPRHFHGNLRILKASCSHWELLQRCTMRMVPIDFQRRAPQNAGTDSNGNRAATRGIARQ